MNGPSHLPKGGIPRIFQAVVLQDAFQ